MLSHLAARLRASSLLSSSEEGQTLVEYALIIALVAILCIGALTALSTSFSNFITTVVGDL
jgi:Flp pilus assembly pilin Flp